MTHGKFCYAHDVGHTGKLDFIFIFTGNMETGNKIAYAADAVKWTPTPKV